MRKEIIVAVVVGIGVGVAIAFGIWRANSALTTTNPPVIPQLLSEETPEQSPEELKVNFSQPEQNEVIVENPVTIAGITKPLSWVAISGQDEDYAIHTGNDGSFSQEIELSSGVNQIIVAAVTAGGAKAEEIRSVVFSTEFAKEIADSPSTPTTSPETTSPPTDAIREKVKAKLETAKKNPKAYIGSVTDKLEDSLQIKNSKGEIQLISVDPENVSFAKVTKTTANISFADIAIGDFVVAMGLTNGNTVLTSKRILVTEALSVPSRKIIVGKITAIAKKTVTLRQTDGADLPLTFPKKWKGPDLAKMQEDDALIVFGEIEDDKLTVRTVEIITPENLSPTPEEE